MSKDAKIIGVYGGRGQGKSTYVKAMIGIYPRIIVFDPMAEYVNESGFKPAYHLTDIQHAMIEGQGKQYRIAYVPPQGIDYPRALHELCVFLEMAQQPYANNASTQKICVVVEELNLSAPSSPLPSDCQQFVRMCAQGRHFGVEIIGVTQRPKMVMPNFRSLAAEEVIFKISDYDDISAIDRKLAPEWKGQIFNLQVHEFLKVQGSTVTKGKNTLSRA